MKICFIAPAGNYHIQKWCKWFACHHHEVYVISFDDAKCEYAEIYTVQSSADAGGSDLGKIRYLLHGREINRLIKSIDPDIINVHYATSYGTVAALSGVKNYILSVWGSDVYDFPQKSILHKWMLEFSLHKAAHLFSTSRAMAKEASKYTNKPFEITPFGVDMELFSPEKRTRALNQSYDNEFVVGTVKALTPKYGIDYLLKATAIIRREYPHVPIRLRIAGTGSHENSYKQLSESLGISDITTWLGLIPQEQAAREWANMDVGVIASTLDSESFGVSAIEAQASGIPLITSDIPGLLEATRPGITSKCVQRKNEEMLAKAIMELYNAPELRKSMGTAGREYVKQNFELDKCFEHIEAIFRKQIGGGYTAQRVSDIEKIPCILVICRNVTSHSCEAYVNLFDCGIASSYEREYDEAC